MEEIDLDTRDRRNLYNIDAENVVAVETSVGEIVNCDGVDPEDDALDDALMKAADITRQTGQRFAYVVIKVCR